MSLVNRRGRPRGTYGPNKDQTEVLNYLSNPDLSFTEIANKVGLSRERVRQIARDYLGITGRQRQVERREEEVVKTTLPDKHPQQELIDKLSGLGLNAEPSFTTWGQFVVGHLLVNGFSCRIYQATLLKPDKNYYRLPRPAPCDFVIYKIFSNTYLVVPYSEAPTKNTSFCPQPVQPHMRGSKSRKWQVYLNRWDLFKKEETRGRSDRT